LRPGVDVSKNLISYLLSFDFPAIIFRVNIPSIGKIGIGKTLGSSLKEPVLSSKSVFT